MAQYLETSRYCDHGGSKILFKIRIHFVSGKSKSKTGSLRSQRFLLLVSLFLPKYVQQQQQILYCQSRRPERADKFV